MSLFPAYSNDSSGKSPLTIEHSGQNHQAPSWLNNTSFKDFQDNVNRKQPIEISSDSDEDQNSKKERKEKRKDKEKNSVVISSSDSEREEKLKKKKSKQRRSRSKSRERYRSRRSRSKSRKRRFRSRSRSSGQKRSHKRHSRSRSKSTDHTRHRKRSPETNREEIIANSKFSSKKVFIEEVGVSLANAFREDRKGDRTNFAGTGLYAKDVAKYKTKLKYPLGKTKKQYMRKLIDENPRFHHKSYIKQVLKAKNVVKFNTESILRSNDDINSDFFKPYLSLNFHENKIKTEIIEEDKEYNPLGIYSAATENYLKGVGGLEEKEAEVFENDEIQEKRMEYNTKLRESPGNVDLWIEFIDFQDEALKETVFQLNDEKEPKKLRRKNGEILRAKALTERKLAICKSAIEKNTRSIDLAVKRLELSRDLFDSKTLDQQWKELIFVYPENVGLWKRYLLFVQTHYIRFSIPDTIKAYKGCILKLRNQLEKSVDDCDDPIKILEIEHGIIDIIESAVLMLVQSGHSEKAVAVYQGLLELNLFSPDFQGPGDYNVEDKLSLFEPIWDSGVNKVGQAGARGWGKELQERIGEGRGEMEELGIRKEEWEEKMLEAGSEKGKTWIQLEIGREQEHFFPWRKGEEEAEDPERIVEFDTINGFLAQFSREESKFRVLLSFLKLLGVEDRNEEFCNLVNSGAGALYLNTPAFYRQDFAGGDLQVLQAILPTFKTQESLAIFTHFILAQTYDKFSEPFRTKIMSLWLDFECEVVKNSSGDKSLKKGLKKLVKSLLKEDRNNIELVVKYAEVEYQLTGYQAAQSIVETSLTASSKPVLDQKYEENIVASSLLFRAGVELELREICRLKVENIEADDSINKDRLQWLLIQVGSGGTFKPMSEDNKMSMLALVDSARGNFERWISEKVENPKNINFFKLAPNVKHSLVEVIFLYAWLVRFTSGYQDSLISLNGFSKQVASRIKNAGRFVEEYLTLKFIQESIDKICYDLLWYESLHDIKMRQNLRSYYITCLQNHPNSGYFLSKLGAVEGSTSVVSSVWREVCKMVQNKSLVNYQLVEQVSRVGLTKFIKVLDPDNPGELPSVGLGFLNKLHNLLEFLTNLPTIKHSPLVWRLLLWTTSVLNSAAHSTEASESLKTVLYRAIQDVPWCKGLYLDTALYLDKIGELYTTTKQEIVLGGEYEGADDVEDEVVEPKFEEIPGTLEHVTELMVEKDLRVRLPLQELDVLLDPV
eukprot:GFUD01032927.1.p1 GENE.GFUD01032927.1~~GFUD01032927.1.p1  ORF type:complete len:1231 (+),score=335.13 GFUD01032927.1:198-3890(+)